MGMTKVLRKTALNAKAVLLAVAVATMFPSSSTGQQIRIYDKAIHTLRLSVGNADAGEALPILKMGDGDVLSVSFDEQTHVRNRFTYTIEHVDENYDPEQGLFQSDYVEASQDEIVIEDCTPSISTSVAYNHYSFSLPNVDLKPLLSGNYKLSIFKEDDNYEKHLAAEAYFGVCEEIAGVGLTVSGNTDIDSNDKHQQLELSVGTSALGAITRPEQEVSVIVLQNGRWDSAVRNPKPTSLAVGQLQWSHSKELIFEAGNEYRKFELTSTRYPGMHVEGIKFFDPFYHATLFPDEKKKNYIYDQDQNGIMRPRADSYNGTDDNTDADYVWVHFSLQSEYMGDGKRVFVNGRWTYDDFSPKYELKYDQAKQAYCTALFLKQGYYSYQYLCSSEGSKPTAGVTEGNFWQTENDYTVLVYFKPLGSRYTRLVGYREASFRAD